MNANDLPFADDDKIRALLSAALEKETPKEFAARAGSLINNVYQAGCGGRAPTPEICSALGVRRLTRRERMRQLWCAGLSPMEIADREGVTRCAVLMAARAHKFGPNPFSRAGVST